MSDYTQNLNEHYGRPHLYEQILAALAKAGLEPARLRPADLAPLDEFHTGGRQATLRLLAWLDPAPGARLLDLGCGIGGPARTLADQRPDLDIVGVDIVAEYCRAARKLNELTGFANVTITQADLCELPPAAPGYAAVWSQHALMNLPDKAAGLSAIVAQFGRERGAFAFHEACAGPVSPPHYPVPWAGDPALSHLVTTAEWRALLRAAGFSERCWADVTVDALAWIDAAVATRSRTPVGLNTGLLLGPDAAQKSRHLRRNLAEGRLCMIMGVFDFDG